MINAVLEGYEFDNNTLSLRVSVMSYLHLQRINLPNFIGHSLKPTDGSNIYFTQTNIPPINR